MAKKRRRLSVKMKRTLRITAAVLFLASAVGVALIPQKGAEAEGESPRVTLTRADSSIPVAVNGTDTVYTTGDGVFQFCYLQKGTSENKVAVIVGYDYQRSLDGGTLRIPDTMDAYVKYTHSQGTEGGYVAVGRHGKPLYYPSKYKNFPETNQVFESDGVTPKKDAEGNDVYETIDHYEIVGYSPCLYSNENVWKYELDYEGNPTQTLREDNHFYYRIDEKYGETVLDNYTPTADQTTQRLKAAEVAYISNQHVEKSTVREEREITEYVYEDDGKTKKEEVKKRIPFDVDVWTILDNGVGEGIFSKAPNITTLITGSNLLGIGDYSFYNCANLRSITLGDGANTIGNYAFANCVNLKTAEFPLNSSFSALGDHAFYNCRSLQEFTVPTFVQKIGDSAFEGCTGLKHIDLNAGGNEVLLNSIGNNVFRNCTGLEELVFPQFYPGETIGTDSGIFKLEWLEGCESLKYIKIPNKSMQMESSTGMSHEDFQKTVPKEFYFEAASDSRVHEISKNNNYAFKYLDEERYEKVEGVPNNTQKQTVYVVNDKNELIYFLMGDEVEEVNIPDAIGPYKIKVIGSDSFQGKCQLKSITIPASIEEIQPEAFMGCHNLKNVIFEENSKITKIGDKAFATQLADSVFHNSTTCGYDPAGIPTLSFTGEAKLGNPIFEYAMNPVNKINNSSQPTTYITFYTGWPSNLVVKYNPTTDKNELIDYLSIKEIDTPNIPDYPYLNTELSTACVDAKKFLDGDITISSQEYTENVKNVIDNAYNPILPDGIESIKPGLFSGVDAEGNSTGNGADTDMKTITTNGIHQIDPNTFKGCTGLIGAYINGVTSELGDYAFENCSELIDVDIHSDLTTFGLLPFKNCDKLTDVDFGTNPNFDCTEAIIFENYPFTHAKLLEVLESRGVNYGTGNVTVDEMKGVAEIRPESFKDCEGIMSVDFSQSTLSEIPESAFENTPDLYSVKFNNGIKAIRKNAFKKSGVRYLEIPNTMNIIDNSAFSNPDIDDAHRKSITFYCEEDSPAASYATNFPYIYVSEKPLTFKVSFYDEDGTTLLETLYVEAGQDAKPSVQPSKPGYTFKAWFPEPKNVLADMNVFATYSSNSEVTFTVTFLDYDDTVLSLQTVKIGQDAVTPVSPTREGYDFTGWRPAFTNVQSDITTYAQYEKQVPDNSESGSGGSSEKPSGGGSNNNNPNGTNTNGQQLYTVIVKDGSGSGSYVAGATVIVAANDAPAGKAFDKWTVDNESVTLASTSIPATTFVMPSSNVTITANYKDAKTSSNNNNGSNGGTNSSNTGTTTKPNTTVSITKPGFSNENLASAVVSGSTDNFVLKITDSATAKKEIEDALEAQYGSTKNLKYLAMDISLYDSTGKNKIENKDDLKVTVTMPIPDELIPYAGNNRVAYVINGKLVELSPKFTTINGVSCISFVAPHFSPYTIYVDTTNLTAAGIQDYTPKTGDGISPKWFLAAALLCVSAFLFIKKDKKSVKVKAK